MSDISILLIGDADRPEFRQTGRILAGSGKVRTFRLGESAAAALSHGHLAAEIVVLAQAYPGQFSPRVIEHLRGAAPLARIVLLLGSWCEGEVRSGNPPPGVIRLYWHQWPPRWERQYVHIRRGESSAWGLPRTAIDEERLLQNESPSLSHAGLIAIHTPNVNIHGWLSDCLRDRGCSTVWLRPPHPPQIHGADAAIFEGSDCRGEELGQLRHLADALRPAPIVALLDFPRIQDHDRALAAGAATVVSKPLELDDLLWHLGHLPRPLRPPQRPNP